MATEKLLEQLFLLEVVVDKLALRNRCDPSTKCLCTWPPYDEEYPLRIRVKFINFPCFEIEQEHFSKAVDEAKGLTIVENFSSGKSCLFPMAPLDLVRAMQLYPLAVTVYQRPTEMSPATVIGVARVPLSREMVEAVRRSTYCKEELPINTNLLGKFPLMGPGGKDAGRVHVFVRLSCFGQSIVTQFQLVDEFQSFLFKNSRADTAFECKRCLGDLKIPAPVYRDILPLRAVVCDDEEGKVEEIRDSAYAKHTLNPKALASLCECDVYREDPSGSGFGMVLGRKYKSGKYGRGMRLPEDIRDEVPFCRGCEVLIEGQKAPCEERLVDESAPCRKAPCERTLLPCDMPMMPCEMTMMQSERPMMPVDMQMMQGERPMAPYDRPMLQREEMAEMAELVEGMIDRGIPQTRSVFLATEDVLAIDIQTSTFQVDKPDDGTLVVVQTSCKECCEEAFRTTDVCCEDYEPGVRVEVPAVVEEVLAEIVAESISAWSEFGKDIVFQEPIIFRNPPIRYDTTGILTGAFDDLPESSPFGHPPIRYDTTSRLTDAFQDRHRYAWPPNPKVRYDTTGKLSPAFEGAMPPVPEMRPNPPVRYDTTGCLSPAFQHPPIRYDTTGCLSAAYEGEDVGGDYRIFVSRIAEKLPESVHLLGYKPLMSYDVGPDFTLLELRDLLKKPRARKPRPRKVRKEKRKPLRVCQPLLQFPTVRRGHKRCLDVQFRVPSRMGWLWNTSIPGLPYRPGWRPGAVMHAVSLKIENFHKEYGMLLEDSLAKKRKVKSADEGKKDMPPTLILSRRRGKYHLSVRPMPEATERPTLVFPTGHFAQTLPSAALQRIYDMKPYSVDLTVSSSSESVPSSSSMESVGSFSATSGIASTSAPCSGATYSSSSSASSGSYDSVCPPCECVHSDDTDSLKIEFMAPANFPPRWKFPSMHHQETNVKAEELIPPKRKSKVKTEDEKPPDDGKDKKKKKKGSGKGKGKGKKGKKGKKK